MQLLVIMKGQIRLGLGMDYARTVQEFSDADCSKLQFTWTDTSSSEDIIWKSLKQAALVVNVGGRNWVKNQLSNVTQGFSYHLPHVTKD